MATFRRGEDRGFGATLDVVFQVLLKELPDERRENDLALFVCLGWTAVDRSVDFCKRFSNE